MPGNKLAVLGNRTARAIPARLVAACVAVTLVLAARPAAAKVCLDQGTITGLQVSANGPDAQWLQIMLDGRATYVATSATLPAVFSGFASLASGAYFAGKPIRVGYEQGPTANMIQFIEAGPTGPVPAAAGCSARSGPAARR